MILRPVARRPFRVSAECPDCNMTNPISQCDFSMISLFFFNCVTARRGDFVASAERDHKRGGWPFRTVVRPARRRSVCVWTASELTEVQPSPPTSAARCIVFGASVFCDVMLPAVALVAVVAATASSVEDEAQPLVQTALGAIRGSRGAVAESFRQIPYAQPPLNELRFAPPQPGSPWAPATLEAALPGPPTSCWQSGATSSVDWQAGHKVFYSEDCLTLDLYRPRNHAAGGIALPLLLFIHGGGFTQGAAHEQDGSYLATSQRVIVATVNYRLGALLRPESPL
eukprot:COSAG02_NODE_5194_length_4551_cov_19.208446_1_plen_283_part_10